ncbi:MAG: NUDIX hydrolase [Kiritimatiellae bacterium]|nr:NUDIX hydrolase [Kiritimatiellia bacterium]MDD4735928.1 NUDIX hydrolase [Kiritimatiellia bacterium]
MYEKTLKTRQIYQGRILDLEVLDIEMANGTRTIREIVRHKSAVAALAALPDERFVFVRQFRKAIESDVLELIAGLREEGEEPEEAAWREIQEETGYTPVALIHLGKVYPSPGYTEEYIDLYFAQLEEQQAEQSQDDDERVEVVYMTEDDLYTRMQAGELYDAKLLAAWALYERLIKNPVVCEDSTCCCNRCDEHGD